MGERRRVSREEFIRRLPEGEGAGPDAPETDEPRGGRPGAGGHGPRPGRPDSLWPGPDDVTPRRHDELPDPKGVAGMAAYLTSLGAGWLGGRLRSGARRLRRRRP